MHEVCTDLLWIGNALDARSPQSLFDTGVKAVVDLAYEELPAQLPRQLIYCRFPLNDGEGNHPSLVTQTLLTTENFLRNRIPTLIACSAGMSRSPTITAFTMALFHQNDPQRHLTEIGKKRSLELKPQLWADVDAIFKAIMNVRTTANQQGA